MFTIAMTKFLGKAPELSMKTNLPLAQQQLLEKVLYVLSKTGGLDYYHLFKILYFAERSYLTRFCRKMVEDNFCALPLGPVPTNLYDAIRGNHSPLSVALWQDIRRAGEDAAFVLIPQREPNMDYIAKCEAAILDEAVDEYAPKTFDQLKNLSHGKAWSGTKHCGVISSEDIALEGGLDAEVLPYLREQLEWQAIEKEVL